MIEARSAIIQRSRLTDPVLNGKGRMPAEQGVAIPRIRKPTRAPLGQCTKNRS